MTQQDGAFAELMKRVQEGSQDAAKELLDLYGPPVLKTVRQKLHPRLRSKFDSMDFVQDVWVSFFVGVSRKFAFKGPEDLVNFLTTVARNKVVQAVRTRLERQKFNVKREVPLDSTPETGLPPAQGSPSEGLRTQEEWLEFLQNQPLVHQRIFVLWREGKPSATIAQEMDLSQRTVSRVLSKLISGDPP